MRRNVNGSCPSRVWRAAYLHCRVRALALEGPLPQLFPVLRWFSHGGMIASSGGVGREQACVCVCVCVWRPFLSCAAGTLLSCSHASASFAFPHLSAFIALISDDSIRTAWQGVTHQATNPWPVCGE